MSWKDILKLNSDLDDAKKVNRDDEKFASGTWAVYKDPNDEQLTSLNNSTWLVKTPNSPQKDEDGTNIHSSKWPYGVWRDVRYEIQSQKSYGIKFSSTYNFGLMTSFYNGWLKEQGKPEVNLAQLIMNSVGINSFMEYVVNYHREGHRYTKATG